MIMFWNYSVPASKHPFQVCSVYCCQQPNKETHVLIYFKCSGISIDSDLKLALYHPPVGGTLTLGEIVLRFKPV